MTRAEQLRLRLLGFQPTDTLWGWLGPLFFAAVGGLMRFWSLGRPHQLVFDETYYVKQGVSMLDYGVEMRVPDSLKTPDALFTAGTPDVFGTEGDLVVHPPVGKWIIAIGEQLFGQTSSFGWRFSVCVLGTLSILMIGRAARRMFGSSLLGTIAAFLLAFEGHHFVQSRTGLLDLIVMFWALAAFCALLIDRDRSRALLAERVAAMSPAQLAGGTGPWLGARPWRWVAGICLGLCAGTKWSGLFFLVAFGLMTVLWDVGARRAAGVRHWFWGGVLRDGVPAALVMCGTALVVYLVSWTGWFVSSGGYDRQWAASHPDKGTWVPAALRSLWEYHQEIYKFHVNLHDNHPYKTNPWSWVIQGRPTSFFYEGPKRGTDGCMVAQCSKAITSIGTVSVWWLGAAAIVVCLYWWLFRRDWRAGAILAGLAGGYLPWFGLEERTIYSFYTVAFEPWIILGVVFVLGLVLGPRTGSRRRREIGLYAVGAYCLLTLALFAYFWPIYTAQVIPQDQWSARMWFPSWI